ncbi:MAG: hypothetical protein HIU89_09905 [Proteobacteria bacterium]|nr:hypothetical protein [Pseudomonadota bacterium]
MNHTLLHRGIKRPDLRCMAESLFEAARNGPGVAATQIAIAVNALTTPLTQCARPHMRTRHRHVAAAPRGQARAFA